MTDQQIVELYWNRDERAIHETILNTGNTFIKLHIISLQMKRTARRVSMKHTCTYGIPFRQINHRFCLLMLEKSYVNCLLIFIERVIERKDRDQSMQFLWRN